MVTNLLHREHAVVDGNAVQIAEIDPVEVKTTAKAILVLPEYQDAAGAHSRASGKRSRSHCHPITVQGKRSSCTLPRDRHMTPGAVVQRAARIGAHICGRAAAIQEGRIIIDESKQKSIWVGRCGIRDMWDDRCRIR